MSRKPRDPDFVGDLYRVLQAAENVYAEDEAARVRYLRDRAALLHRAVDLGGDEGWRWVAQDAEGRAERAAAVAAALADPSCAD